MIGISWYNFEKSDRKDTWSALFLCKKGELVQGCIEKGQSQKGDTRQRKLSGTIQNLRKLSRIARGYLI